MIEAGCKRPRLSYTWWGDRGEVVVVPPHPARPTPSLLRTDSHTPTTSFTPLPRGRTKRERQALAIDSVLPLSAVNPLRQATSRSLSAPPSVTSHPSPRKPSAGRSRKAALRVLHSLVGNPKGLVREAVRDAIRSAVTVHKLYNTILERSVRSIVQKSMSLNALVKSTTFAEGVAMAEESDWGSRVVSEAVVHSDWELINGIWSSAKTQGDHPPGWFDLEPVVECAGMKITRKDLCTLSGRSWLNDEIINVYFRLVEERSASLPATYPKVHALSSHWYKKLTARGYSYQAVKRWTKKVDVFAVDKLLIPVNCGDTHWTFACVDFEGESVMYCDSLGGTGDSVLENILAWLADEYAERKKASRDFREFEMVQPGGTVPQQDNSYDCGVFTCMFASCAAADSEFCFGQEDMPYLRQRMVIEILNGKAPIPPGPPSRRWGDGR